VLRIRKRMSLCNYRLFFCFAKKNSNSIERDYYGKRVEIAIIVDLAGLKGAKKFLLLSKNRRCRYLRVIQRFIKKSVSMFTARRKHRGLKRSNPKSVPVSKLVLPEERAFVY
jgi:hypothetical protein